MLDERQFLEWKDKYWNIYYVEIEGEEFLFRELSRAEYKKGLRLYGENTETLEEYICVTCVLEPQDYDFDNCIAGIPTTLANFILTESGFTEDTGKFTQYLEKYRQEMMTLDNQIACVIKEAFQDISIEEIESWPMEKTIWYYSRAEYILRDLRGINLVMESPEEIQEAAPAPAPRPQANKAKETHAAKPKDTNFNFQIEGDGSVSDFPELAEIEAFMKGKWNPPPTRTEGEELL